MTRPLRASKVLLVADRRAAPSQPDGVTVRRYRLARLRLDGRPAEPELRFEHAKRA